MNRQILFNKQAQEKLLKGVETAFNAVAPTLGPKGLNAFIQQPYQDLITNDGFRILASLELEDKFENMGLSLVKNASAKQNDDVGDGTTTVAILTKAIIDECLKRNENPMEMRESLNLACKEAVKLLKGKSANAKPEDLIAVAKISSENAQLASMIAEVITKLGEKAVINIQDSPDAESSVEVLPGYDAPVGYASPYFINDQKAGKAVFADVRVLVSAKKMASLVDLKPIADIFDQEKIGQCVFVVDEIDSSLLGVLVKNSLQGAFKSVVIIAHGEVLEDIAAATGATIISDATGVNFQNIQLSDLGKSDSVSVSANKSVFLGSNVSGALRAQELEGIAEGEENQYRKEKLKDRAAKLRGGVGVLKIGANTDYERDYLKLKAEDAVKAVQAAMEEGIVPGGGTTLWDIAKSLPRNTVGLEILGRALKYPMRKLAENSAEEDFDASVEAGIIDPLKVERCAVENAVSAASSFITAFCAISDAPSDQKQN